MLCFNIVNFGYVWLAFRVIFDIRVSLGGQKIIAMCEKVTKCNQALPNETKNKIYRTWMETEI